MLIYNYTILIDSHWEKKPDLYYFVKHILMQVPWYKTCPNPLNFVRACSYHIIKARKKNTKLGITN